MAACSILLTSAYQFSQVDAKSDHESYFFKGFPSVWNFLVFYLILVGLNPWFNLLVVFICDILVFVPIKYIYPSRTTRLRKLTLVFTYLWGIIGMGIASISGCPEMGGVDLPSLCRLLYGIERFPSDRRDKTYIGRMFIEKITQPSEELLLAMQKLIPQLGVHKVSPTFEELTALIASEASILLAAREPDEKGEMPESSG